MKKATRYLLALAVCIGIFALWVLCQMYVAKGTLIGVLFCGAMFGAWKAIVSGGEPTSEDRTIIRKPGNEPEPEENRNVDEQ